MKIYIREIIVYPLCSWKEYYDNEEKANEAYKVCDPAHGIYVNDEETVNTSDKEMFMLKYCSDKNDFNNSYEKIRSKIYARY